MLKSEMPFFFLFNRNKDCTIVVSFSFALFQKPDTKIKQCQRKSKNIQNYGLEHLLYIYIYNSTKGRDVVDRSSLQQL